MDRSSQILIVDDEEPVLAYLSRAARIKGYEVQTARDGRDAWRLLLQDPYDLVVTDLRMPGIDGPGLMGRIRGQGMALRVVVITGHATLEVAVDCLRKGALDFLMKPFDVGDFLASIKNALAKPLPIGPRRPDWGAVELEFALTPRQRQLLESFYASGKTNRELAQELCLSPHTVKSHLKSAFLKLGVSNRAQLIRKLSEVG